MFLHPWAIAMGLLAVGVPLAIHWLTKPRPVVFPLSTLRFVRSALQQRRAQHRLRDAIVLALRMLAVLLIAFGLARPQSEKQLLTTDASSNDTLRIVVLDVSQSLGAVEDGVERLERARTMAAEHLRFRQNLRTNLILAGATPRAIFTEPSMNAESLRGELTKVSVLPERCDVKAALALAGRMLAPQSEQDERQRELVVVSDFQRSNWAQADFSVLPAQTKIQMESVAASSAPANMAILGARARGRSTQQGETLLEVELANYSPQARSVTVDVALGQATGRLKGELAAGQKTTLTESIRLPSAGWQVGSATLLNVDDALAADDWRPIVIQVEPPPVYALVTRQPAKQRPSSSHYLECALVPESHPGTNAARVVRINPETPDREQLLSASAIVVDHPGGLSPEAVMHLSTALRNGKPILFLASETIDATNLHKLAEASGGGAQLPVEFLPLKGEPRRNLFLTSYRQADSPFGVFGDSGQAVLGRLRFASGLTSRRREGTLDDDLLASYDDGTASLVLSASQGGTLAVLNADLEHSNLPKTPEAFVPLVQELLQLLLERRVSHPEGFCGETLVARLPVVAPVSELTIESPAEAQGLPEMGGLADEGLGVVWSWQHPSARGVFQIKHHDQTVYGLAINTPAEESDLESLPPEVLKNRLAAGRDMVFRTADNPADRDDSFWVWLLAGCVVCLVGEIGALLAFRT